MKSLLTFLNTVFIIGITQGIATWLYLLFLPKNFFFMNIFSNRSAGICLGVLTSRIFNIRNTYIDKLFIPLLPILLTDQFFRYEAYHREKYITENVLNMHHILSLFFYFIPFATGWIIVNLTRKLCIDWNNEQTNNHSKKS